MHALLCPSNKYYLLSHNTTNFPVKVCKDFDIHCLALRESYIILSVVDFKVINRGAHYVTGTEL